MDICLKKKKNRKKWPKRLVAAVYHNSNNPYEFFEKIILK